MPTLSDVVDLVHGWYPPDTADERDAVGLVHGDPAQRGRAGAVRGRPDDRGGAARRPSGARTCWSCTIRCSSRGVHGFAETTPKGRTLATLVRAGCALLTAHTNADRAVRGRQ